MTLACKHIGVCGGCSLIAPYDDQLARKRARLQDLLGIDVPPLAPSPRQTAFRQKAAFAFASPPRGRGLLMGHYAAGSHRIVPVDECPVHSARANRIAFALCDRLVRANVSAADTPGGVLRHLVVRTTEDDSEAVAMLVVSRNDKALRTPVRGLLASAEAPDGFSINVNTRPGPYMVGENTIKIAGRGHVRERGAVATGGSHVSFLVSPDAFFQTNVGAARTLVQLVLEGVPETGRVLDLYCGSGLFALPLARRGATVTAVEESRTAIADLEANVKLNRIEHGRVTPVAGRVEDVISRLSGTRWDAVVLDPPRDGCAPGVVAAVFERIQPPRAVYVSCNPEVLAEDLRSIRRSGYAIERVQAVDMFPHTAHLETVVTLTR
ncbi:MAG TPA: 23S rRNA (uracil(1939)-C(5))-methyltransferase RlmD [Vicinamibacterales bacterium]|nr:23S rRNA (uracil(1939)-C(5))-methyltransferase RlmD [Vicinamibacterales bacterium]